MKTVETCCKFKCNVLWYIYSSLIKVVRALCKFLDCRIFLRGMNFRRKGKAVSWDCALTTLYTQSPVRQELLAGPVTPIYVFTRLIWQDVVHCSSLLQPVPWQPGWEPDWQLPILYPWELYVLWGSLLPTAWECWSILLWNLSISHGEPPRWGCTIPGIKLFR